MAASATACQSRSDSPSPVTWTCATALSMRVRTSRWKPLKTDNTVISTVMPSAMPTTEISDITEMNFVRWRERV